MSKGPRLLRLSRVAVLLFAMAAAWAQPPDSPAQACVACHGSPPVSSLAGQPRPYLEQQLRLIRDGRRSVPAMRGLLEGLTEADLSALAQHFASQPAPLPATSPDPAAYQRGQMLAVRNQCAGCHQPGFTGQQFAPRLAGQPEAFLLRTMRQLRHGSEPGRDTIMSVALNGLKDSDLADLAHYLAHVQPAP